MDPCFGEDFAKTADACKECTAPVVVDGEIYLMREVCRAICRGALKPTRLNRLTSRDVRDRLFEGATVEEIWAEILGDSDPEAAGAEARKLLYNRLYYIERNYDYPTPDLPTTDELVQAIGG